MTRRGWVLFLALGVIWGVPYLFIRVAVAEMDPVVLAFARTGLAALLLLPVATRRQALRPLLARWRWLLLYTGVEIVGPWLLLGHAETRVNSATAGLLVGTVAIVAAVAATLTGQDRLSGRRVLGLLLGFVGVAVLVGLDFRPDQGVAVMQMLGVVAGYAIGPIIVSRHLADLPPIGVVAASLAVATVVYAPFAASAWPAQVTAAAAGSMLVLAVVCTAAAFLVMFALIAEAGPARMSMVTYVTPLVAVLVGAVALREPLTSGLLLAVPLILAGSVLGTERTTTPVGSPRAEACAAPVAQARV